MIDIKILGPIVFMKISEKFNRNAGADILE